MTFRDRILQQHCERISHIATDYSSTQLLVIGLLDACRFFQINEGDSSPRAAEALEHLLSPELRPDLRQWYRESGEDMNPNALAFRDRLSELAGEKFE